MHCVYFSWQPMKGREYNILNIFQSLLWLEEKKKKKSGVDMIIINNIYIYITVFQISCIAIVNQIRKKKILKKWWKVKKKCWRKHRIQLMYLEIKTNNIHFAKWQVQSLPLSKLKQAKTAPEHNPMKLWIWQRQCFKYRAKEEQAQLQHTPQFWQVTLNIIIALQLSLDMFLKNQSSFCEAVVVKQQQTVE